MTKRLGRADAGGPEGADTLSAQIGDLDARIARLGAYIDARYEAWAVGDLCRLLDLHSKMLGRATQMRRVQHALYGQASRFMAWVYDVIDKMHLRQQGEPPEPGEARLYWAQGQLPCASE